MITDTRTTLGNDLIDKTLCNEWGDRNCGGMCSLSLGQAEFHLPNDVRIVENFKNYLEIFFSYEDKMAPPRWTRSEKTMEYLLSGSLVNGKKENLFTKSAIYTNGEGMKTAKEKAKMRILALQNAEQRVPVYQQGIVWKKKGETKQWENFYTEYFKKHVKPQRVANEIELPSNAQVSVPPAIAIFTQTPVYVEWDMQNTDPDVTMLHRLPVASIIHVYALDFSTVISPDVKIFCRSKKFDLYGVIQEYSRMLGYVIQCAVDNDKKTIQFACVGCESFAPIWWQPKTLPAVKKLYIEKIVVPALYLVLARFKTIGIQVAIQDEQEGLLRKAQELINEYTEGSGNAKKVITLRYQGIVKFKFPSSLKEMDPSDLQDTLFVNAWDPVSMIGNANADDGSLDGWVGRSTASALLGWPKSNPFLKDRIKMVTYPTNYGGTDVDKQLLEKAGFALQETCDLERAIAIYKAVHDLD